MTTAHKFSINSKTSVFSIRPADSQKRRFFVMLTCDYQVWPPPLAKPQKYSSNYSFIPSSRLGDRMTGSLAVLQTSCNGGFERASKRPKNSENCNFSRIFWFHSAVDFLVNFIRRNQRKTKTERPPITRTRKAGTRTDRTKCHIFARLCEIRGSVLHFFVIPAIRQNAGHDQKSKACVQHTARMCPPNAPCDRIWQFADVLL